MNNTMKTEMINAYRVNKFNSRKNIQPNKNNAKNSTQAGFSAINYLTFTSNPIKNEVKINALETKLNNVFEQNTKTVKSVKKGFTKEFAQSLATKKDEPIIITITGESASGKSTLCSLMEEYAQAENLPISFISADNYFKDISALIKKYGDFDSVRNSGYDIDAPENFQLDVLRNDIMALKAGEDIKTPQYLINGTGINVPKAIDVKNNKIIVIEGMASGYNNLQELTDMSIYVDAREDIRSKRFMKRAKSRNQSESDAFDHWNYVRHAGKKYVQPLAEKSDIILNGAAEIKDMQKLIQELLFFK